MYEIMNYDVNYINRKMTVEEAERYLQEMSAIPESMIRGLKIKCPSQESFKMDIDASCFKMDTDAPSKERTANYVVAAAERYASKFLNFDELDAQSSNIVEYASLIMDKLASLLEDKSYDQDELMTAISKIHDMVEYVNKI